MFETPMPMAETPAPETKIPILQLGEDGLSANATNADISHLKKQFAAADYLVFPRFLSEALIESIHRHTDHGAFSPRSYDLEPTKGFSVNELYSNNHVNWILHFFMRDPKLMEIFGALAGCRRLLTFQGRIYKFTSEGGHQYGWHQDLMDERQLALSVNLGRHPFDGGQLQIRKIGTERVSEIHNAGPGDAVLFRIAPDLEHQVLPVSGPHYKMAFAGWFFAKEMP